MTPKEEADELYYNYHQLLRQMRFQAETMKQFNLAAKECALSCVDKILKAIPMYNGNLNPKWKHYKEVKTELEKL